MRSYLNLTVAVLVSVGVFAANAVADDRYYSGAGQYRITITNLTRGSLFTPALVVTHKQGLSMFSEGSPASEELAQLAEGGATEALAQSLIDTGKVHDSVTSPVPVLAGQSVTLEVATNRRADHLSLAAMILPTNDGFIALNGIQGPKRGQTKVVYIPGYDAGSELNDEFCTNIPGPQCGGEGYSVNGGEGYVHIHAGIHGNGDLSRADYDWRNPIAKVTIEHLR